MVFNFVEVCENKYASSLNIRTLAWRLYWLLRGLPQSASKQMLREEEIEAQL
jgi:hypothetical protein